MTGKKMQACQVATQNSQKAQERQVLFAFSCGAKKGMILYDKTGCKEHGRERIFLLFYFHFIHCQCGV
jgi:hypothetical protein